MSRLLRTTVIAVEVVLVLVIATRWGSAEPGATESSGIEATGARSTVTQPAATQPPDDEPTVTQPAGAEPPAETAAAGVVLLAGDSILRQTGPALEASLGAEVVIRNEAVNGSGLLTPGVLDWVEHLPRLVEEQDPDVVVLSWIGNYTDTDFWLGAEGQTVPINTLAFYAAWAEQANRIMQDLEAFDGDVYWVLPPPAFTELNQQITAGIRQVYTDLAARWPRVQLLDANAALAGPTGEFLGSVQEPGGAIVDLRASDTVHLTEAGATRLAQVITQGIEGSLSR